MSYNDRPPVRDLRSEDQKKQAAAEAYWPVVPFADDQTSYCCGVQKQWRMRLDVAQDRSKADANCLSEVCPVCRKATKWVTQARYNEAVANHT